MAAGDEVVGLLRWVYESPTGARSTPLIPDLTTGRAQQTSPENQPKIYADWRKAMNENGYLLLQHRGGTGSQVHDSSVMTVNAPIAYREKAKPGVVHERFLTAGERDTTKLTDDVGDDTSNFVTIMAWKVTPGQIWALGGIQVPELQVITESTA